MARRRPEELNLGPVSPLAAARARRYEVTRQKRRASYQHQIGRLCDILVHLLDQAKVGTPRPIIYPTYTPPRQVFQVTTPRRVVKDWRSLPVPDLWSPKPAPTKPKGIPPLYGTRYRSAGR